MTKILCMLPLMCILALLMLVMGCGKANGIELLTEIMVGSSLRMAISILVLTGSALLFVCGSLR